MVVSFYMYEKTNNSDKWSNNCVLPTACSLFPAACSMFPIIYPQLLNPYSLLPTAISLAGSEGGPVQKRVVQSQIALTGQRVSWLVEQKVLVQLNMVWLAKIVLGQLQLLDELTNVGPVRHVPGS